MEKYQEGAPRDPHLAFIMDGNRRWAKAHMFRTLLGHAKGADVMEDAVDWCLESGVSVASFWALAKKNIEERDSEELGYLYELLIERVRGLVSRMLEKDIRFRWVGNRAIVPANVREALETTENETSGGRSMILAVAVGYGGQDEIVQAVKAAIRAGVDPESLNEKTFLSFLDSGDLPPPDLIVRTGGDTRHSGYYLYGSEYSEYYFTKTLWPDFGRIEFEAAHASLKGAKRNFGK